MSKILTALVFMLMVSTANAAIYHFFSSEKLAEGALEWEKYQTHPKDSDLLQVTEFAGYVGAIFDHLSEEQRICAPDDISKNVVLDVVAGFLKNKRKGLKNSGSVLVEDALIKKYRCGYIK
jgi:hypothetical protein